MKRCAAGGAGAGGIIGTGAGAGAATTGAGAGAIVTTGAGWSAAPCVAASAPIAKFKTIGNLPLLQKPARPPGERGETAAIRYPGKPLFAVKAMKPVNSGLPTESGV